jgi:sugar phosphate isomerase/epimerase
MNISFHTDAFNSAAFSFMKAVDWAQDNDLHRIECGVIEGTSWIHGLGYFPHISLNDDPIAIREKMEKRGVRFSQIDAAYPLSGLDGLSFGIGYILKTLPWAKLAGCENIATTDGLAAPEGLSDSESMELMKRSYGIIVEAAEKYGININIEIHGYFTTKPDYIEKMLAFCDTKRLGLNFDTGNSFISGEDPVSFCRRFLGRINHVHLKDVSGDLAAAARGEETGIAVSHCAIGDGVNADNIVKCLELLRDSGYTGTLSMETEGAGGRLIEKSLRWLRKTMKDLGIPEEIF